METITTEPQDITEALRIRGKNLNAKSISGREGDLLLQAADEIEKLRDNLKWSEDTCNKGYAEAYNIIMDMRDRLQKQKESLDDQIEHEYLQLKAATEAQIEAEVKARTGEKKIIGWGLEQTTKNFDGKPIYMLFSNNQPHAWTEDGGFREVTAKEYAELEVDYLQRRFGDGATYRIFPIEV